MRRRSRWLIPYIAVAIALIIRVWMSTIRLRIASADGCRHPVDPHDNRYLYAFWHEGLLATLATKPKIRVLISQHTDGEVIAQICQRLRIGVIRGSTARGGYQALLEMIRNPDDSTHLGITPDGPRGPRRQLKPGVVMIASQSGLAVVPAGIGFVRAWRVGSWDRFALPCPGSVVVGVIGEPIFIPRDLDRGSLQQWVQLVEEQLLELTRLAEDWALRIRHHGKSAVPPVISRSSELRQSA